MVSSKNNKRRHILFQEKYCVLKCSQPINVQHTSLKPHNNSLTRKKYITLEDLYWYIFTSEKVYPRHHLNSMSNVSKSAKCRQSWNLLYTNNNPVPPSEKVHLFKMENAKIFTYLLFYIDHKQHILLMKKAHHLKNDANYDFFEKHIIFSLEKCFFFNNGNYDINKCRIPKKLTIHIVNNF